MKLTTTRRTVLPSIVISLMTGLSLAFSGCGAVSEASAPASITNAVKGSVNVCDLVDAQQLEGVTASQITSFAYEHDPIPANQSPNNETVLPTLHCRIYFPDDTAFSKIEIHYQGGSVVDFGENVAAVPFDQAMQHEGVEEISSDNAKGQGFTYEKNDSGPLLAWRYPDGHILTMRVSYAVRGGKNATGLNQNIHMLMSIFQLVGNQIPQVASSPKQELTFYPEDSNPLRDTESPRPVR